MTNLPDDWNAYFRTCEDCGARYHLSGTDECECPTCDNCHEVTAESNMDDERDGWCSKCADKAREDEPEEPEPVGAPTPHIRRTPRRVALKHLETLRMWADEEGAP